jgi:uncharacterized protein
VKRLACLGFAAAVALRALSAAEVIPPAPAHYFNDYAGIISQTAAGDFDQQLTKFSAQTSNQVVVAIFPKMQSDDDIAAYTQRIAESWRAGQKDKRNGIVLFVFVEDRKMIIQVGYGLEGALPDIAAFDITEHQMKPQFAAGNYEAGLRIGIDSILNTIRGEYRGTGQIVSEHERKHPRRVIGPLFLLAVFFLVSVVSGIHRTGRRGHIYSSAGNHWSFSWADFLFFWLNLLLSGSSRGGSSGSSSGGGGFSGGGGSFGGGGAGSSW